MPQAASSSITSWSTSAYKKKKPASFSSKSWAVSSIYLASTLSIATWSQRTYYSISIKASKLSTSAWAILTRRASCWRQRVGRHATRRPRWSLARSITVQMSTSGLAESFCLHWFAGTYPLRIQIPRTFTRKYWVPISRHRITYRTKLMTCWEEY